MNQSPEASRFAPPRAHVQDVVVISSLDPASRGARFAASLVDGILIGVLFGVLGGSGLLAQDDSLFGTGKFLLCLFAGFALINGYTLAKSGQTLGKMALGIRIVRSNGDPASLGRVLGLRFGIGVLISFVPIAAGIYGLVDSLLIFRESRQCLHDNIADTIVIKA